MTSESAGPPGRTRLASGVADILAAHGWSPTHDATDQLAMWCNRLGSRFHLPEAARDALVRYGGLSVLQSGPGIELGRHNFELDPALAIGEEELFREHGQKIRKDLFPLGEAMNAHLFLAISTDGEVYALMGEDLWFVGEDIDTAITRLVEGRAMERIE